MRSNTPPYIAAALVFSTRCSCLFAASGCEEEDGVAADNAPLLSASPRGITTGTPTANALWTGVVAYYVDYPELCTATLIHPRILLTARHCLVDDVDYTSPDRLKKISIVGGADVRFEPPPLAGVSAVVYREDVDIALMFLDVPVDLPTYCLRRAPGVATGEKGVIVGYGRHIWNDPSSYGISRYGETTVLALQPYASILEVGDPTASCHGDSGGPLYTEVAGEWLVTGICSGGIYGCSPTSGSYYTDIAPFIDWVDETATEWVGTRVSDTCTSTEPDIRLEDGGLGDADADVVTSLSGGQSCGCRAVGYDYQKRSVLDVMRFIW